MDPQLKERLIGAAVLVALGVWLIPLVLDGPEAPLEEDAAPALELPLPEDGSELRRQTVNLDERDSDEAPAVTAPEQFAATETADAAAAARPAESAAKPTTGQKSAPPGPSVTAPASPRASAEWMVQLGSFGDRENADRLAKRVATFGTSPEVSTFRAGGRVMYRVRVGPHESRELAEAAASSLSAHGFVAQVVSVD